jgi:6,7-dimethyl-8-ribityllumazine synthase
MRDSFSRTFSELDSRSIDYFEVPGAFEIPLKAKILALTNNYAAVCCGGLVVDGGIYRHEFVAHAVINGLMQVQLDTGIPVFSGVLTPQDFLGDGQPAFFKEHFITKGEELASACHQTLAG